MAIERLTAQEVAAECLEILEPDAEAADLGTPEVIAAAVRRAASFTCPTTPRLLREAVEESLRGLLPEEGPGLPSGEEIDGGSDSSMRLVREALDNLVALGDLVEVPTDDEESGATRRMLFLGPTSYVRVSEDTVVLLGVRADGIPILDESLADRVEYRGHVRRIRLEPDEDPAALLGETGLGELSKGDWLQSPPSCQPETLVNGFDKRIEGAGRSGTVENCQILDPAKSPTYYKGRWRPPKQSDSSNFVAKRPAGYGSDIWCYAKVHDGRVQKLVDLPVEDPLVKPWDEAWRLQAAIDRLAGHPQQVRSRTSVEDAEPVIDFFSPIPSWAQRYLEILGVEIDRQEGALFSYRLSETDSEAALEFLGATLWIARQTEHEEVNG